MGLQFEPTTASIVALEGAMWFDPSSRELRMVDYRFTGLPAEWRPDRLGGSVELHRADRGIWITRFRYQRTARVKPAPGRGKDRLLGFRESGAEVTDVEVAIDTTDRVATARAIARQAALARGRFARMVGAVVDSFGVPIADAEVALLGSELETKTSAKGQFVLSGLPLGLQIVRVRKVGFKPSFLPVRLAAGQEWDGKVTIGRLPMTLGEIVVVGKYGKPPKYVNTAKYDEFYRRRASKIGKFVTREEIDKVNTNRIADLIRGIPGIRTAFNPVAGHDAVEFSTCPAENVGIFVDGQRLNGPPTQLLALISARDIETLEVYQRDNLIPPEFQDGVCAAIVVWTR